jgi:phage antirepressor YoqD-like protein
MGAIVFGQAHDQPGILIEPKAEYAIDVGDEDQLIKFRNLLWLVDLTGLLSAIVYYRLNASFIQADY